MARPKKHENGSEQIQARIPTELKQKVVKAIEDRPGLTISDVVIEALTIHGSDVVELPDILRRRAVAVSAELGVSLGSFIVESVRMRLDRGTEPVARQVQAVYDPELGRVQPRAVVAAAMAEAPFGKSITDFLEKNPPMAKPDQMYRDPENWPTDEVPTLEVQERGPSWSEVFAKAKREGDFGSEYFGEQTSHIGRFPPGFANWPQPKQVAWLDEKHPRKPE